MGNQNFMIKDFNDKTTVQYELFEIDEKEYEELINKRKEELKIERVNRIKNRSMEEIDEIKERIKNLSLSESLVDFRRLSEYLAWGRFHKNKLTIDNHVDLAFQKIMEMQDKRNSLNFIPDVVDKPCRYQKLMPGRKIRFILPLYEEFFGSLEEKHFSKKKYEEIDHEWNLNEYQGLIAETLNTFSHYGEVNQHNNSFTLRIPTDAKPNENPFGAPGASYTYLSFLEDELLENLKWVLMG